jgi:hypothetical protein
MNISIGQWMKFEIPLSGNGDWPRTISGNPDLSEIDYVEFNADVWDYGFEMWVDGLTFTNHAIGIGNVKPENNILLNCSPNPSEKLFYISYFINEPGLAYLLISDLNGRLIKTYSEGIKPKGIHSIIFDGSSIPAGVYLCRLVSGDSAVTEKLVLVK